MGEYGDHGKGGAKTSLKGKGLHGLITVGAWSASNITLWSHAIRHRGGDFYPRRLIFN